MISLCSMVCLCTGIIITCNDNIKIFPPPDQQKNDEIQIAHLTDNCGWLFNDKIQKIILVQILISGVELAANITVALPNLRLITFEPEARCPCPDGRFPFDFQGCQFETTTTTGTQTTTAENSHNNAGIRFQFE